MMNSEFLSDILECSVCLKPLDEQNKVLPCQHTFCKSCLHSIVKSHKELRCPECRVLVQRPVDELPSNILLIRLLDGIKFQQKQILVKEASYKTDTRRHSIEGILNEPVPASGGAKDGGLSSTGHSSNPHFLHKHSNSEPGTAKVRVTSPKPHARALYSYNTDEPNDLTFQKGETIHLLQRIDKNWMRGELNGKTGVFPVNYVKILQPLPSESPFCVALYDFQSDPNDPDRDCLHFTKNDSILVIRKVDDNWAEGVLDEKIGIFPLSFVKLNDEARKIVGLATQASKDETQTQRSGATGAAARRLNSSKQGGKNTKKRHSFPVFNAAKEKEDTATTSYRHSVEFGGSPLTLATPSGDNVSFNSSLKTESPTVAPNLDVTKRTTRARTASAANRSTSPSKLRLSKMVVAAFSYKSQKQDELDLIKGDSYLITEVCRDGWCRGSHVPSGKTGVFPGNYINSKPESKSTTKSSPPDSNDSSSTATDSASSRRTYSEFLNAQFSKSPRESSKSKLPLSARLPLSSALSRSAIPTSPSSGSVSRLSPEQRPRPIKARPSSATPSLESSGSSKPGRPAASPRPDAPPPPRPAPPAASSFPAKTSSRHPRPVLKSSTSLEESNPSSASTSSPRSSSSNKDQRKKDGKSRKQDRSGFFSKIYNNGAAKSKSPSSGSTSATASSAPTARPIANKSVVNPRDRYYVTMDYPGSEPEDLDLHEGDVLVVESRRPDGWFKGKNLNSGESGYFPSTFVERFPSS